MTTEQIRILVIILIVVTAILLVFFIIYPIIRKKHIFNNFKIIYYKKIRKVADIRDYYLINNLTLKQNGKMVCKIDHVLFGDKYIYVIKDRYYRGGIKGEKEDSTWFFYDKKGKKSEMDNPMKNNELRIEKLSLLTQIDKSFFISVVIINDDCVIKKMKDLNNESSFIISSSKFQKLVKAIEQRDVQKIDENQLKFAVEDISKLYGQGSEDEGEND